MTDGGSSLDGIGGEFLQPGVGAVLNVDGGQKCLVGCFVGMARCQELILRNHKAGKPTIGFVLPNIFWSFHVSAAARPSSCFFFVPRRTGRQRGLQFEVAEPAPFVAGVVAQRGAVAADVFQRDIFAVGGIVGIERRVVL